MKRASRFIDILLVLALAQPAAGQPYGFLSWSVEDGLPQSQVTALAQDDRGYLWVGTNGGGVARFDGEAFEVFGVSEGLEDNFVRGVVATPQGDLFVLTRRGLAVRRADSVRFQQVELTHTGALFLGADAGGVQWGEGQWLSDDRLRFTTAAAIHTIQKGNEGWSVTSLGGPQGVTGPTVKLRNGTQLHGTRDRALFLLSANGEPLAHYTENAGDLPHNTILSLLEDRQGRVWIGTSGGGLVRMIPTGLRYYNTDDGLAGNRVYALHAGNDKLWIGTSNKGIQYFDEGTFQRPPIDDPTFGTKINSITQDGSGRTYFATDGRGVAMLDSNRVRQLTRRSALPSPYVLKLLPAGDSSVLAITYAHGLAKIDYFPSRDSFAISRFRTEVGTRPPSLASAIYGPDSTLLLGTTDGRILQRTNQPPNPATTIFGPDQGLPPGRISALLLRRNSQLWVAVLGYGLYYTDLRSAKPRFFPLPPRLRNMSGNIFQLTTDPNRPAIWIGTERGLIQLFLNANGQPDYTQNYGRAEGFLGGETTRGATTTDSLGRLWFGTLNGLVRYETNNSDLYLAPPPTFLERVNIFYRPVDASDYQLQGNTPVFAAADNHFQFRYGAVDLTYADRLRYRFQLRGETPGWSPLTDERAVRYAGLSPGRYTFLVEATTDGGKTFGKTADYTFIIREPVIRSAWFLALLTLLLATLIIGGSFYFFRRVQRQEAALREELETQNRLLGLEQKARQLQMNPHFIFNALNGIRGLVDGQHDSEARAQITRFATLMRGILNNSRQEMISLADEIKVLGDYIEMERFCQNIPINYQISVLEDIDPEEVSLPPMLIQPFVENAILHGLAGRESGGTIKITFSLRGRRLQCEVVDDGVGRKAAAARRGARAAKHRSVAVGVTRERLESAGGSLTIEDAPGGGTRVVILTPVDMW